MQTCLFGSLPPLPLKQLLASVFAPSEAQRESLEGGKCANLVTIIRGPHYCATVSLLILDWRHVVVAVAVVVYVYVYTYILRKVNKTTAAVARGNQRNKLRSRSITPSKL